MPPFVVNTEGGKTALVSFHYYLIVVMFSLILVGCVALFKGLSQVSFSVGVEKP